MGFKCNIRDAIYACNKREGEEKELCEKCDAIQSLRLLILGTALPKFITAVQIFDEYGE